MISVIIPTYNNESYLRSAIQSVLCQTYTDYEIIVVDDGSTDNSREIVKTFGDKVGYLRQENQGLAGARNTGIQNARNSMICLLDADDQWSPSYLQKMVNLASEDPGAAIYYCCAQAVDKYGEKLPQVLGCPVKPPEEMLNVLLRANFLIPSTVMMNYSTIKQGDYFDKNFRRLQDWELWIRLLKQGYRFVGLPEVLVNYRIHEESLSKDPQGGQQAAMALVRKHFGVDDGKPEFWTSQKRRAFGGTYRYHALMSIQRQEDWDAGSKYLSKAFEVDPTLSLDLDLFYELALSGQPSGYRDANHQLEVEHTFTVFMNMLANIFDTVNSQRIGNLRSKVYGTANYAMGLVAYNTGRKALSRRFLLKALFFRPELGYDRLVVGNIVSSFMSVRLIAMIKNFFRTLSLRAG